MNNQHILLDYDNYVKDYKSIYGENTIVLIQLGSFFEMCSDIDNNNDIGEKNIHTICDNVLDIAVGKKYYKTKNDITGIAEQKDYLMAGFPLISQEKHLTTLLENNYTIVLVEQITEPPNPERKVTQILSPGTNIFHNKKCSNYLVSIYIEKFNYMNNDIFQAGISAIDLSTGKNYIHQISHDNDNDFCFDEISRLINFYNASELIFQTENFNLTRDDVLNKWDINHDCFRINHLNDTILKKPSYQNDILRQTFNMNTMLNPMDELNISIKNELRLSYMYMIFYIKEHKNDILKHIERPIEHHEKNYMTLTSNSIRQLNVVNNYSYFKGKNESLLAICNQCSTAMGKRMFKDRLLYPSINIEEIQNRYLCIEEFRKDGFYNSVQNDLSKIGDLDKSLRLMGLNLLQPYQLYSSHLSYEYVKKVIRKIMNADINNYYSENKYRFFYYENFMKEILETFNFKLFTNDPIEQIERSIFIKKNFEAIDDIDDDILYYNHHIDLIVDRLSKFIDSNKDCIKITQNKDHDEWLLFCTKKRAQIFKQRLQNIGDNKIIVKDGNEIIYTFKSDDFTYKTKDGNNTFIVFQLMKDISKKKYDLYKRLSKLNKKYYDETIDHLYETYHTTLKNIHNFIADVDVSSTNAKVSILNNYHKPEIVSCEKSFIKAKEMRHPIVERINTEIEYVTNDVTLNKDGILLFGTNACGKSTFMKAIGLNLIMAQAGLYVACSEFKYFPYTQIFTRILNNDNIFKSESSFAVEMNELRGIINRADDSSLVLGDELCSGTETNSALRIVYAGLSMLSQKYCSFVFTSHLHQLTDYEEINMIENLKIFHLEIKYDGDKLIYDRKLKKGSGPSIYGMKVCEALGLSQEFLDIAKSLKIDKKNILKTSPYNKKVIVDQCKICNEKAEETHHIVEQCEADENGNIKHFHKNNTHNLVPLCKKCHDETTYGKLVIEGYIQTNNGKELKYHYVEEKKKKRKKYEDSIEKITSYRNEYEINKSNCIKLLELNENIKIGRETLKKIMENKY